MNNKFTVSIPPSIGGIDNAINLICEAYDYGESLESFLLEEITVPISSDMPNGVTLLSENYEDVSAGIGEDGIEYFNSVLVSRTYERKTLRSKTNFFKVIINNYMNDMYSDVVERLKSRNKEQALKTVDEQIKIKFENMSLNGGSVRI